ncbi:DUF4870 domain-containing protein [Persicirhabdus sediminis]|uniref:DUF4870 domain-containing protein n=1 Tax=Persicirhabdus sediminis TaxID=454144 RepID=A0A8J7MFT4_9BACT|nr:DUF4870 domain-containing protein [Persicirhabdus sediminis]MBK1791992.1 DUF4870 domain-containing protein [Persicirhabdus sediminis]
MNNDADPSISESSDSNIPEPQIPKPQIPTPQVPTPSVPKPEVPFSATSKPADSAEDSQLEADSSAPATEPADSINEPETAESKPPNIPEKPAAAAPPEMPQTPANTGEPSPQDRQLAMLAHLSGLVIMFLGPLLIPQLKPDIHPYTNEHCKEALNFQLTILIAFVVSYIGFFFCIGALLLPAVILIDIIFCIIAAMKANEGQMYRYPMTIRFIK